MKRILKPAFFNRPTLTVAEELLGKFLVRKHEHGVYEQIITEVEAYDGPDDRASHAARGKTERNAVMFGPAGYWYVYFVYGMHEMLNIVTGPEEYPAAILIRGVTGISGPGRLTKALGITRKENRTLATRESGLWIEDRGIQIPPHFIKRTPRIGVDYAGSIWSKKKYRFLLNSRWN